MYKVWVFRMLVLDSLMVLLNEGCKLFGGHLLLVYGFVKLPLVV